MEPDSNQGGIIRYGRPWPNADDFDIERWIIQQGGTFIKDDKEYGNGLVWHYERLRQLLWPWVDDHRWYKLCRDEILKNKVTVLMGAGSTGKTFSAALWFLAEYFCFPHETCVLVSSTDMRGLDLRVWGEIKMLWSQAKEQFPQVPGNLIESRRALTTDNIDEQQYDKSSIRDLRKGVMGIPTIQNGKFIGLGKWIGTKQKRMRLIADEGQFMGNSFLDAFSNLNNNPSFKAVVCGNPNDILDCLGKAAEPTEGWSSRMEPKKTITWDTKFFSGRCINLVGPDSPNFDPPETATDRYPYLVGKEKISLAKRSYGEDSIQFSSQCLGIMKISVLAKRVINRDMCKQFHAHDEVIWRGGPTTKIGGLDAAYGGDRCVCGHVEFSQDISGRTVLLIHPPVIIPLVARPNVGPEDVIAEYVREYCEQFGVPPENFFHDATGRGSLGTALARIWSDQCMPVEFGGNPTERIVSMDHFVFDKKTQQRRHAICSEYYSKFVSELWFSVRYAIEADQVRGLPEDVMDEGCMREYKYWNGKIQLETKEEMKKRAGRSPDLFDWLSICVEGARRRGFQVAKLANAEEGTASSMDWFYEAAKDRNKEVMRQALNYRV